MTTQQQPIWKSETELMQRLLVAQNRPENINRDIMTIAGFFTTREQLEKHVLRYEVEV